MENVRIKQKVKRLVETVADLTGTSKENGVNGVSEADLDYDDIGRDFILVGGVHDPLSLRHEVSIRDKEGIEHKSAERYYWYKMAEYFNDTDAMQKIQQASNVNTAEAAMKEIKNFDEESWNKVIFAILFLKRNFLCNFCLKVFYFLSLIRDRTRNFNSIFF